MKETKSFRLILRTLSQIFSSISPQASQITGIQKKFIIDKFQNNNLKTKHHNNGLALPASTYLDSAVTLGQRRKEVEKACCSLASVFFSSGKEALFVRSLSCQALLRLADRNGWLEWHLRQHGNMPAEAECSLPCKHRQSTTLSKIRMCKAPSFSWD